MKRLVIALFVICLTAWCASAQYARPEALKVKSGRIYADGIRLADNEAMSLFADLNGYNRSYDYLNFRHGYKVGVGLMTGGAAGVVLGFAGIYGGLVSVMINPDPVVLPVMAAGCILYYGGFSCLIAGIPVLCVYNSRLKDLSRAYNSINSRQTGLDLSFGPTNNGVGFALNF